MPDVGALKPDDFVLIKFETTKTSVMYIGKIKACIDDMDDSAVTFEVKFLRREKPKSFTFVFPLT